MWQVWRNADSLSPKVPWTISFFLSSDSNERLANEDSYGCFRHENNLAD